MPLHLPQLKKQMINKITTYLLPLLCLFVLNYATAQTKSLQATQLETTVYKLNNKAEYESSFKNINYFLKTKNISDEDAYYGNLFLSETYKRIFDYNNVLLYLDKAESFAKKMTINKQYYLDNITCQKAFTLFDIQRYTDAKVYMRALAKNECKNLTKKAQAMLIMQDAYLLYLDKNYIEAEQQYDLTIRKMYLASPCDLPIIYVKKISLYGAMNNELKMQLAYKQAIHCADSCNINKYNLYAVEIMRNTYQSMGKYKMAFKYFTMYDSLNTIYNADGFKNKLQELEVEYETNKKEHSIYLKEQIITSNNRFIALLIIAIVSLILMIALYITLQRRKKLVKEKQRSQLFTKQLLNKTEVERKRIATDLHDSVNNDLLLIKSSIDTNPDDLKAKIDLLMNHVRDISRNLHPVLFEELGLQDSIEQLVERVQENNKFILNTEIEYKTCLTSMDELQIYRIIQEAVNNIIKYSDAEAAIITMNEHKEKLTIEIKDNGKGFNVDETLSSKKSFGLYNIIERSKAINGLATIVSNQNGTTIKIEIQNKN